MSEYALNVFDGDASVGRLEYESLEERFAFGYSREWIDAEDSYSLSPHIPVRGPAA